MSEYQCFELVALDRPLTSRCSNVLTINAKAAREALLGLFFYPRATFVDNRHDFSCPHFVNEITWRRIVHIAQSAIKLMPFSVIILFSL